MTGNPSPGPALTVATYNLYQGSSMIPAYLAPDVAKMAEELRTAYHLAMETDVPGRIAAIVSSLAACRPHALGVQEVALWRHGDEVCDFLQILQDALRTAGLDYQVAATVTSSTLALHTGGDVISVTDRDAILARADVPVTAAGDRVYAARIEQPVPSGLVLTKLRGWAWADLGIADADGTAGTRSRVVCTHLEAFDEKVRLRQAEELADALAAETHSAVVVGDLNSAPGVDAHAILTDRGFSDAWVDVHGSADGFTALQSGTLDNEESQLSKRWDHILVRAPELAADDASVLGADRSSRLPAGLWPSDHAGVVATLVRRPKPAAATAP